MNLIGQRSRASLRHARVGRPARCAAQIDVDLKVEGMTCSHCTEAVQKALEVSSGSAMRFPKQKASGQMREDACSLRVASADTRASTCPALCSPPVGQQQFNIRVLACKMRSDLVLSRSSCEAVTWAQAAVLHLTSVGHASALQQPTGAPWPQSMLHKGTNFHQWLIPRLCFVEPVLQLLHTAGCFLQGADKVDDVKSVSLDTGIASIAVDATDQYAVLEHLPAIMNAVQQAGFDVEPYFGGDEPAAT